MIIGPVFIRTVTHNYIAKITGIDGGFLTVEQVSWVGDTGCRLGQFLAAGPTAQSEIEPMPTCHSIGMGAVVDNSAWAHALPTVAQ